MEQRGKKRKVALHVAYNGVGYHVCTLILPIKHNVCKSPKPVSLLQNTIENAECLRVAGNASQPWVSDH